MPKPAGIGFLARLRGQKDHGTPSRKVIVRGWRCWNINLSDPHGEIRITSPFRGQAAVLEAHCDDPSCKPPGKGCACGVYLRYEPPSFDEVQIALLTGEGYVAPGVDYNSTSPIYFFCEALGKVIYGDIGARAERVRPLFCIIPPVIDDVFRKLRLYLPAYFGPQLQLLKLGEEEIENLKWGEVWEE